MLRGAALRAAWAAPMKLITQVIRDPGDCPSPGPVNASQAVTHLSLNGGEVWSLDILRSNSRGLTLTRSAVRRTTLSPRARERSTD